MKRFEKVENLLAGGRVSAGWVALCLAAVTLAVFWRATQCDFVNYDDDTYLTDNRHVQQGLTAESLCWAFTSFYEGTYVPLTMVSHMLVWQVCGSNPWGHHLVNVALHAVNAALLLLVLRSMTGSLWRSTLVAALFALHPLHVETAAWVAERKGLQCTLFWLLALWSYTRYARLKTDGRNVRAATHYMAALASFACSLLTKPLVVTLPCVLLLLDYWPLERWKPAGGESTARLGQCWRRLVTEKIPFFLLSALCSVATIWDALPSPLTTSQRVGNALVSYPRYLWKTLWPAELAMPYPHPWNWPSWDIVLAAAFLTLATSWALLQARRRPYLATGWLWFLGTLVPVIGVARMGFYAMADRYSYLSLIGIFIIVAWAAGEIVARWKQSKRAVIAMAAVLLGLCAWRSRDQVLCWQDSGTLFTHALRVTKNNHMAHNNLGSHLYSQGRYDEALEHFVEAARIQPEYNHVWENIFSTLAVKQLDPKAAANYTQALRSKRPIVRTSPSHWSMAGFVALGMAAGLLLLKAVQQATRAFQSSRP